MLRDDALGLRLRLNLKVKRGRSCGRQRGGADPSSKAFALFFAESPAEPMYWFRALTRFHNS